MHIFYKKYQDFINFYLNNISVYQLFVNFIKNILKIYGTMCCKVPYKRYIFAVQITMQRKVESLKKNYISCNEIEN